MRTRIEATVSGTERGSVPYLGHGVEKARTLLLISEETGLYKELRTAANASGDMVVRALGTVGTEAILEATKPSVLLLDLDMPNASAWNIADHLMRQMDCPAVILLTDQIETFEPGTAVRAGCLVNKRGSISELMELVEQVIGLSEVNRAEWNGIQRVLLRWLKPSTWPTPAYRFWGINE